jgi:hypothetical protein
MLVLDRVHRIEPTPERAVAPPSRNLSMLELRANQCRFPTIARRRISSVAVRRSAAAYVTGRRKRRAKIGDGARIQQYASRM